MSAQRQNEHLVIESFPVGSFQCNCSVIYSAQTQEALIIDPGNDDPKVAEFIATKGLKVKKLLHTHAHFDHIGQSSAIQKLTGASIHLHRADQFLYDGLEQQGSFFRQIIPPPVTINSYLEDSEEFGFADDQLKNFLKTLHTPGHTPGSCCFYTDYFATPILFAGDTLFQQSIGRTDLPGGDGEQIIRSIKSRLLTLPPDTEVITGHGPETKIHLEKSHNPFF